MGQIKCACKSEDPYECAKRRYAFKCDDASDDPVYPHELCECGCHDQYLADMQELEEMFQGDRF